MRSTTPANAGRYSCCGAQRNGAFLPALSGYLQHDAAMTTFPELERITFDPDVMGGKPCIRGMRVTVGMILGLIASGTEQEEILRLYPYLEAEDIRAALAYGA